MSVLSKDDCLTLFEPFVVAARRKAEIEAKVHGDISLNRSVMDQHEDAFMRKTKADAQLHLLESIKHHLEKAA